MGEEAIIFKDFKKGSKSVLVTHGRAVVGPWSGRGRAVVVPGRAVVGPWSCHGLGQAVVGPWSG